MPACAKRRCAGSAWARLGKVAMATLFIDKPRPQRSEINRVLADISCTGVYQKTGTDPLGDLACMASNRWRCALLFSLGTVVMSGCATPSRRTHAAIG